MTPPPFLKMNLNQEQYREIIQANKIYNDIVSRNLYQQIIEIADDEFAEIFLRTFLDYLLINNPDFDKNDFAIFKTKMGFVNTSQSQPDPFDHIYFYDKKENEQTFTVKKSHFSGLLGNKVEETHWHLVCKNRLIYHRTVEEIRNYCPK